MTFALPMAIWIMSSFFRELPRDLEHAAYMDGATPFQAFRKVMLPLAAPGVFTSAILVFIATWNEFLFAISLSATTRSQTIPAAISFFQGENSIEIPVGPISAASVVVMLPLDRDGARLPAPHRRRPHGRRRQGLTPSSSD